MTVRTRPVRIFEADHEPLRLLAGLEKRSPAQVFHAALAQYMHAHRAALAATFRETQELLAAGDLEGLTRALSADLDDQVDAAMAAIEKE